jgi:hypothetical protein
MSTSELNGIWSRWLTVGAISIQFLGCGGRAELTPSDAAQDGGSADALGADVDATMLGVPEGGADGGDANGGRDSTLRDDANDSNPDDADAPLPVYPDAPPFEIVDAGFERNGGEDAAVLIPDGGMSLGTYDGYFENYQFRSGSDAVLMKLAVASDGTTVSGVVVLGDGTPPPPPDQPNVGYPPGYTSPPGVLEGYAYTALIGTLASDRLTLSIDPNEPWNEWCQIQTSYPDPGGFPPYNCIPPWCSESMGAGSGYGSCTLQLCADGGGNGKTIPIDCEQGTLCGLPANQGVCTCTKSGCSHPLSPVINFDMQVSPMHLDGSTANLPMASGNVNVHLTEQ